MVTRYTSINHLHSYIPLYVVLVGVGCRWLVGTVGGYGTWQIPWVVQTGNVADSREFHRIHIIESNHITSYRTGWDGTDEPTTGQDRTAPFVCVPVP